MHFLNRNISLHNEDSKYRTVQHTECPISWDENSICLQFVGFKSTRKIKIVIYLIVLIDI